MTGSRIWTVGELTRHIRLLLESDPPLRSLWLQGELSNVSYSLAGHVYFTLKDSEAAVKCVLWRSTAERLGWRLQQGAQVVALGRISVYAAGGVYQLYVDELRPAGVGDLHARFEAQRERLRAEGLFDAERKRPLPPFPRLVGVVTSPQAAALQDVLHVLRRRYPLVRVLVAPTLVQGEQAPAQIVAALRALDARDDVDLILLVRGGGSLEELWAFNDEQVARAIVACRRPVVCGVGHETDFTIADFCADVRAPTPSAAAEMAVPDQAELRQLIGLRLARARRSTAARLAEARRRLASQERLLQQMSPQARLDAERQRLDELVRQAGQVLRHRLALQRAALEGARARLAALSPQATLARGYAIVRRQDTGAIVDSVGQVQAGDGLRIQVQDGEIKAVTKGQHD